MDPLRHPDLIEVGRRLRDAFDRAAAADLETARVAHARARGLRELLIEWEDAGQRVRVTAGPADTPPMTIEAVGFDHVVLAAAGRRLAVPFDAITTVEASA
ncbi:MAG: hypothetical protein HKN46_04880 [Acidimicrobiia bacterium]|nr:hypothetical protein [Acidimicrobiia bacterium]